MNTKTNSPTPADFTKWAAQYRAEGNPTAQAVAQQASEVIAAQSARIAELEAALAALTDATDHLLGDPSTALSRRGFADKYCAARALLAKGGR